MTREQFTDKIEFLVREYLSNPGGFDADLQIRVNPATLAATLADNRERLDNIEESDETVEDAAAAQRAEDEDAMDSQSRRNPDYYPVRKLICDREGGGKKPDRAAIEEIARVYFG